MFMVIGADVSKKRKEYVPDGANLFNLMNFEKEDEDAQKVLTATVCDMDQRQRRCYLSSQRASNECIDDVSDLRVQTIHDHQSYNTGLAR